MPCTRSCARARRRGRAHLNAPTGSKPWLRADGFKARCAQIEGVPSSTWSPRRLNRRSWSCQQGQNARELAKQTNGAVCIRERRRLELSSLHCTLLPSRSSQPVPAEAGPAPPESQLAFLQHARHISCLSSSVCGACTRRARACRESLRTRPVRTRRVVLRRAPELRSLLKHGRLKSRH